MIQVPLFKPQTEWLPPEEFPDLSKYDEIAIDLETKDPNLNTRMGSGAVVKNGEVVGIAVAVSGWCGYYPIAHEGGGNMDRKKVLNWLFRCWCLRDCGIGKLCRDCGICGICGNCGKLWNRRKTSN